MSDKHQVLIVHHNDLDGYVAAWVVGRLHNSVTYLPVSYSVVLRDTVTDRYDKIFVVDFCPTTQDLQWLLLRAGTVVLIDHHETAIQRIAADGHLLFGLKTYLDTRKAACVIAWEHFGDDVVMPDIVKHTGDRDIWAFEHEDTRDYCAGVETYGELQIGLIEQMTRTFTDTILSRGKIARAAAQQLIDAASRKVWRAHLCSAPNYVLGCTCWGTPHLLSEIGDAILTRYADVDVACCYSTKINYTRLSLRSRRGSDIDVAELAARHGGGGHKHAAGCFVRTTIEQLLSPR